MAAGWLESRLSEVPPRLRAEMIAACPPLEGPVSRALAEAAISLYARVVAGAGGRAEALPLLAADALLTHACEARSEEDQETILEFSADWIRRLAELLR